MSANALRRVMGVVAGAGALLGLRALSLVPHGGRVDHAVLRLTWSARPERIESCRELSDAELADLPTHMRLRTQCEGHFAAYLLTVEVDEALLVADTVRGGGLRNDRPIHLLRDLEVTPGAHALHVTLARLDSLSAAAADTGTAAGGTLEDRARREVEERRRRAAEALPARLVLHATPLFERGRVTMITYTSEGRQLVLSRGGVL